MEDDELAGWLVTTWLTEITEELTGG